MEFTKLTILIITQIHKFISVYSVMTLLIRIYSEVKEYSFHEWNVYSEYHVIVDKILLSINELNKCQLQINLINLTWVKEIHFKEEI